MQVVVEDEKGMSHESNTKMDCRVTPQYSALRIPITGVVPRNDQCKGKVML